MIFDILYLRSKPMSLNKINELIEKLFINEMRKFILNDLEIVKSLEDRYSLYVCRLIPDVFMKNYGQEFEINGYKENEDYTINKQNLLDMREFVCEKQLNLTFYYDNNFINEWIIDTHNITGNNVREKIVNAYCIVYIMELLECEFLSAKYYKIYKRLDYLILCYFVYNKHIKLINLYNKIDKHNKQKQTIRKIFNTTFHIDIIDNIIMFY